MEIDSANSALPQGSCFQVDRLQKSLERSAISVSMVMLSGRMVPSRNCLADACRMCVPGGGYLLYSPSD